MLGAVFLGGLGYAGWHLLRPRVAARLEAGRERRRRERVRAEADRAVRRQKREIEDELDALKRKASRG